MKRNNWNRVCPDCEQPEFVVYINALTGQPIDEKSCGKCNRETNCGYHKPPREWFEEHRPERREWLPKEQWLEEKRQREREAEEIRRKLEQQEAERKARRFAPLSNEQHPDAQAYIDRMGELCEQSQSTDNALARWLCTMFPKDKVDEVLRLYRTGSTRDGWIVYWGIDIQGRVHTGKMMAYGPDGHRLKEKKYSFDWVHSRMKMEQLADQCLFGEHRLMGWKDTIAVVESEKTAIFLTLKFPNILWLATGSKQNFKPEVLWPICGKEEVYVLPDADALDEWTRKAEELNYREGYNFIISDQYRNMCTPEARQRKWDLADMMLEKV